MKDYAAIKHFVPCSVVFESNPAEFSIGPVRFLRKETFAKEFGSGLEAQRERIYVQHRSNCEAAIQRGVNPKNVANAEQSRRFADHMVDDAKKWIESSDWIGVVGVDECHPRVSWERGLAAIEAALDLLRVLMGAHHSRKIRTALAANYAVNRAQLSQFPDGDIHITVSKEYSGNVVGDGWFSVVARDDGYFLNRGGFAITALTKPDSFWPLSFRWIDALSWFGQAVLERSNAARLVKYMTAVERLTIPKKAENIESRVTRRAVALRYLNDEAQYRAAIEKAQLAYEWRSRIIHGAVSPFDKALNKNLQHAEITAAAAILGALSFFDHLGLDSEEFSDQRLENEFMKLERRFCLPETTA
jgi:hypothetical protein